MRALLLVSLLTAACGPAAVQPTPADPVVTYEADIRPLMEERCQSCHAAGGIAPFSLGTYDEVKLMQGAARVAIEERRMPPYLAAKGCADYDGDISLSDEQIALFGKWVEQGMERGVEGQSSQKLDPPASGLSRVDRTLDMPAPYAVQESPDEYRCFVLDWPYTERMYITGYGLEPSEPSMVHHSDIFYIKPSHAAEFEALDPNGDGYECYSIPVLEGGWIGTFVPGNRGVDFPEGTGLPIEPGSKVFLQTHYNTGYTGKKPDLSKLNLRIESKVRKIAQVQAMADLKWLRNGEMEIPAFQKDVVHRFEEDPTLYPSVFNQEFIDGKPMKIYAATVHMHQMGSKGLIEIVRKDGTRECVNEIPKWDFHWQLPYTLAEPKTIYPGDKLAIECHWDNSAEAQPLTTGGTQRLPRDLNWGSRTEDEMCVGGVYLTQ